MEKKRNKKRKNYTVWVLPGLQPPMKTNKSYFAMNDHFAMNDIGRESKQSLYSSPISALDLASELSILLTSSSFDDANILEATTQSTITKHFSSMNTIDHRRDILYSSGSPTNILQSTPNDVKSANDANYDANDANYRFFSPSSLKKKRKAKRGGKKKAADLLGFRKIGTSMLHELKKQTRHSTRNQQMVASPPENNKMLDGRTRINFYWYTKYYISFEKLIPITFMTLILKCMVCLTKCMVWWCIFLCYIVQKEKRSKRSKRKGEKQTVHINY